MGPWQRQLQILKKLVSITLTLDTPTWHYFSDLCKYLLGNRYQNLTKIFFSLKFRSQDLKVRGEKYGTMPEGKTELVGQSYRQNQTPFSENRPGIWQSLFQQQKLRNGKSFAKIYQMHWNVQLWNPLVVGIREAT